MRDNCTVWRLNLMLLSVFATGHLCARSEWSDPTGRDREIPALEALVKHLGYPISTHEVQTEDEYILTVFRLPNKESTKYPVFLQHGIHASAAHFLANDRALAYHLFKNGYDVWIGNGRGTKFSRDHLTKSPYDADYWDFSFHEMGVYDIPAVLSKIRAETKKPKVHYIGHSMGTTMFLVMGSKLPTELNYIQGVVLLAPVARPKHIKLIEKPFKKRFLKSTLSAMNLFGINSIEIPQRLGPVVRNLCSGDGKAATWCRRKIGGAKPEKFDFTNTLLYKSWWLVDDVSLKTHKHFLQIAKEGKFQEFDYGKRNQDEYKKSKPPEYKLKRIKKRIYMIAGGADSTASEKDIAWLHKRLPNPWLISKGFKEFTHTHFNYGTEIEKLHHIVGILLDKAEKNEDPETSLQDSPVKGSSESDSEDEDSDGHLNLMLEDGDQATTDTDDSSDESSEKEQRKRKTKRRKGKREEKEKGPEGGLDHSALEKLYNAITMIEKLKDAVFNVENMMKTSMESLEKLKNTIIHMLHMLKLPFLAKDLTEGETQAPEPIAVESNSQGLSSVQGPQTTP